jgi:hypothetical protein
MLPLSRICSGLFATALLAMATPASATPVPVNAPKITPYLLDDADFVVQINVEQLLASPLYTQNYQKQAEELLKMDAVQAILKDTGLDPLKDLKRVTVVTGRSCHPDVEKTGKMGMPMVILEGRFDKAKLQAKAEQLAKDAKTLKIHDVGDDKVYEVLNLPGGKKGFVALASADTLVASALKEQVVTALEKASGKKKTQLKHKAMQQLLEKTDPKAPVSLAIIGEMITDAAMSDLPGQGKRVHMRTMKDERVETVQGWLTVGDDITGKVTITAKDAATGKNIAENAEKGLGEAIKDSPKIVARDKTFEPYVEFLQTIKITHAEERITFEGRGSAKALELVIKGAIKELLSDSPIADPVIR